MEGAVVSFAEGTVKGLIGKLGTVLANEALLLGGVRDEIQYIKDELESMTAFLIVQAQKEEDPDLQVKIWMKQVREMAYDAEDCIDKFCCRIDKPCGKGLTGIIRKSALVLRTLKARRQIATEIQGLKKRTRDVSERQQRYHHHAPASESSKITFHASDLPTPKLYALYPEQVQPVGFDEHIKQITDWLMDEDRPRRTVISIVGFGGLGKTTLAKMAYESSPVKTGNFPCRAFVAVSQRFNVKQILADIFRQVLPILNNDLSDMNDDEREAQMLARQLSEKTFNWDVQTLIGELLKYVNNKRYLIILDDIWDASAWEHLKVALPDNTNGSRIIVTTRIESVANECSRDQKPCVFTMKPLDFETSKKLFYKRVFDNDRSLISDLEQVSNDILKKCGGMPLAINSIAGLLASKPKQPDQWRIVLKSLGSELETNPTLEGIRKILFLSYQNLPHYLKTCFLYLSIYPEDYKIRKKSLISRWMSEGFVSSKHGLRGEEVAKSYFYELVNRSMVIPADISFSGEIKSICVHDMVLEIMVSKSLEENFVSLVGSRHNLTNDNIRRLSVHFVGQKNLKSSINMNLSHIRSLTIFGSLTHWVKSKQLRLVRVLDLEGVQGLRNDHLKYLCKMFQLRYLNLKGTDISDLPSKIKRLQNLETLDIRSTGIEVLPSDIVQLQNLSHVKGGGCNDFFTFFNGKEYFTSTIRMPQGVQNMKSIRTLTFIDCTSMSHKLGELPEITKLGVFLNSRTIVPFFSALDKLSLSLHSLTISTSEHLTSFLDSLKSPPTLLKSLQLSCPLEKLPSWLPSLSNLTKLKLISHTGMNDNDFQVLQKLPNLIILHHFGSSFYSNAAELVFVEEGFPSLRVFTYEAAMIPELRFGEGSACKLEKLGLAFRLFLGSYKFYGIEHIQSLKEVVLKFTKSVNGDAIIEEGLKMIDRNKIKVAVDYYNW